MIVDAVASVAFYCLGILCVYWIGRLLTDDAAFTAFCTVGLYFFLLGDIAWLFDAQLKAERERTK